MGVCFGYGAYLQFENFKYTRDLFDSRFNAAVEKQSNRIGKYEYGDTPESISSGFCTCKQWSFINDIKMGSISG